jgi:enoyl-[acyl-carrier-protein] reductase (NADH)
MRQDVERKAPLGNISSCQVTASLYYVATEASGMTGQTIDVDGGYSIVAGPDTVEPFV